MVHDIRPLAPPETHQPSQRNKLGDWIDAASGNLKGNEM